jgi:hypothetical protein
MAKALESNGADNMKKLHIRVDEGDRAGGGCEFLYFIEGFSGW